MSDVTEGEQAEPLVGAAVNTKRHETQKKRQQRMEREDREFFHQMVLSEAGRRFMWSILKDCHAFEPTFAASPVGFPDPNATWFELGRQDTGQRLYHSWHAKAPAPVMQMLIENDPRFQKVEV